MAVGYIGTEMKREILHSNHLVFGGVHWTTVASNSSSLWGFMLDPAGNLVDVINIMGGRIVDTTNPQTVKDFVSTVRHGNSESYLARALKTGAKYEFLPIVEDKETL